MNYDDTETKRSAERLWYIIDKNMSPGFSMGAADVAQMDPNWGWAKWEKVFMWKPDRMPDGKLLWLQFMMRRERLDSWISASGEKYQYMSVSDFALTQLQK
jgi:hypothetical protein